MSAAFAKFFCAMGGFILGPVVAINTYGLTIHSWPWLILGSLAQIALLGASGAWSKDND